MDAAQVHHQARADTGYAGFTQGSASFFPSCPASGAKAPLARP